MCMYHSTYLKNQTSAPNKQANQYKIDIYYAILGLDLKIWLLGVIITQKNNPNENSHHALNHVKVKCKLIIKYPFKNNIDLVNKIGPISHEFRPKSLNTKKRPPL